MASPGGNQAPYVVVCRAMTTHRRITASLLVPGILLVSLTACTGGAAPSASAAPAASQPAVAAPPASAIDLPTSDPGAGAGGGSSGNAGSGVVDPVPADPNDPAGGGGQPQLVRPRPGQKDPRPVAPTKLEASVDGRHVLVKVSWYSGVEPCSVLDSVKVEHTGSDIAITPFEGIGDANAMCIEIAVLKATIVDLGDLAPGTYRIVAPSGDAPPVEITIS